MWQYFVIGIAITAGILFHDLRLRPIDNGCRSSNDSYSLQSVRSDSDRLWLCYFIAITIALILLAGLRYRIGIDTGVAFRNYNGTPSLNDFTLSMLSREHRGRFSLIYSLLHTLGIGLWAWQLLCAIILNSIFACLTTRYTHRWFTALGIYFFLYFIVLNFETMLAGVAAGMILRGVPDILNRRYGKFYLKMLGGALFHLSIFTMAWLPLLGLKRVQSVLTNRILIAIIILICALLPIPLKYLILEGSYLLDGIPGIRFLGFSSDCIHQYAQSILIPYSLNWKGYLSTIFCNVFLPGCGAWLLVRNGGIKSAENRLFSMILFSYLLLEIMRLEVVAFNRMSMLLLPATSIGLTKAFDMCDTKILAGGLWSCIIIAIAFTMRSLWAPIEYTRASSRIETYYPYNSFLEKGIVYRREWLLINFMNRNYNRQDTLYPIYDFSFELLPGEHEVRSPFHPEQTHEEMEKFRQKICGRDSIAKTLSIP